MKCLAIDVGGTFIKYGFIENMKIKLKGKKQTPQNDVHKFLLLLEEICNAYPGVDCMGISIPGRVDNARGMILTGGALGYIEGLELKRILGERISVPIYVENDAKCAATAELESGSLKGCTNALVYLIGTGIGGGVIIDGKVYKGSNNFAGEFSYLNVRYDELKQNKLSHFCAAPVLFQMAEERDKETCIRMEGELFFREISEGNQAMVEILDVHTKRIAVSLYSLQCLFDVEKIAIGGGLSSQPILLEYIKKNIDILYNGICEDLPRAEIVTCQFENDANLLGAAYVAMDIYGKAGKNNAE